MVYRFTPNADLWGMAVFAALFGLIVLGGFSQGEWEAALLIGAGTAFLGYRWLTTRVVVNDSGLTVRNMLRTRFVEWERIERITSGTAHVGAHTFPDSGIVRLKGGGQIAPHALSAARLSSASEREELARLVEELDAEVRRRA